jgi:hypothetical protein
MNDNDLAHELFLLLGYLLTSAHGLYREPAGYGPFRLVDTAARLLAIMEAHGLSDPYLERLRRALDAERFGSGSDEALRARLDELCVEYATELKQRLSEPQGEPRLASDP